VVADAEFVEAVARCEEEPHPASVAAPTMPPATRRRSFMKVVPFWQY
jgi:hypothetical protein